MPAVQFTRPARPAALKGVVYARRRSRNWLSRPRRHRHTDSSGPKGSEGVRPGCTERVLAPGGHLHLVQRTGPTATALVFIQEYVTRVARRCAHRAGLDSVSTTMAGLMGNHCYAWSRKAEA